VLAALVALEDHDEHGVTAAVFRYVTASGRPPPLQRFSAA
jgi:hypothetical protein